MAGINRQRRFLLPGKQAGLSVSSFHPLWIFSQDEQIQTLHADERLSDQAAVLITSKSNRCVCVLALMDEGAADLQ